MKYNNFVKNFSHYGDILAIPFFALLVIYFYNIEENLPEILNNTATIKIRLNILNDVDKLLHESLNLIRY